MHFQTLFFIDSLINGLNEGHSVGRSIELASLESQTKIAIFARYFLKSIESGVEINQICKKLKKPENKILFLILNMGMQGLPIQNSLEGYYLELKILNETEVEKYQKLLPFKMLIPVMFCFFPAIVILFLGPFISDFIHLMEL